MKRMAGVLRIKKDRIDEYTRYHRNVWPEVLNAHRQAGQTNFSLFLKDDLLFSYFEYTGPDEEYEQRMKTVLEAPRMREWLDIMEDIQIPLEARAPGEWWASMEEIFHAD